ncbi:Protein CBG26865 [Caenorhabditis briggsae]|uniref:Protein CBG26865 n=1 Tax=Caenorhabditis briggsae TaxID=6238 RepID=B6II65_CAEBR|nr:Protein CBG26865 [Caenorhabditis briggsae]CAR99595.1 Protein CBG26865 [Caenorhabditis briggsae]
MNPHSSWLKFHQIERLPNQFNNGNVQPNHIPNGLDSQNQLMAHQGFLTSQTHIAHVHHQHPEASKNNCGQFLANKDNFPINIDQPNMTSEHIQRSNNNVATQNSIPQVCHFDQTNGITTSANAHNGYQFPPYGALEKHQGYPGGTSKVVKNCGQNGNFRGNVHFHNAHQFHVASANHSIDQTSQLIHPHQRIGYHDVLGNQYDQLNQSNKNQLVGNRQHLPMVFKRGPIFVDLTSDDENEQTVPQAQPVLQDKGGLNGLPNHQFSNQKSGGIGNKEVDHQAIQPANGTLENNARMNLNPNIRSYFQPTHPHPLLNSNQFSTQDFESKNQSVAHKSILGSNSELGHQIHHVHQTEETNHWNFSRGAQPCQDHFPGHFNQKVHGSILGENYAHHSQSDRQGHHIPSLHHQGHMPNHAPFHRNDPGHHLGFVGHLANKEPYQFSQQDQLCVNEQHFGHRLHKNIHQSFEQNNPDFGDGNIIQNEALAGQPKHGLSPDQLNQPSPGTQPCAVLNYNQSQNPSQNQRAEFDFSVSTNSSESEPKTPSSALPTDISSIETEIQIEKICRNCGSKNKKRFENRTMLCNTCGMYKRRTGKHRPEECWKRRTGDVQKEEDDDSPGWKKLTKCVNCGEARRRRAAFEREYRCSKCNAYKLKFKRERPKHLWNNAQYQKKSDYKKKEVPISGLGGHPPYQPSAAISQDAFGAIIKPPSCMNCGKPCTNFPENWQKPECGPCIFYKNKKSVKVSGRTNN